MTKNTDKAKPSDIVQKFQNSAMQSSLEQCGTIDAKRPWQNDPCTMPMLAITDDVKIANLQSSLRNEVDHHVRVIKERDSLKAHAEKLAEALREIADSNRLSVGVIQHIASKALAAYESEVRQ